MLGDSKRHHLADSPWLDNIVNDVTQHTMLESLSPYVKKKIHQDIKRRDWLRIIVRGSYLRAPEAVPADSEKKDKKFNWHRPTATQLDPDTLVINCFPGVSYTQHYAGLVATYLSLTGKNPSVVQCIPPAPDQCAEIFEQSNLKEMGEADIVIVGYVYQLSQTLSENWEGYGQDNLFAWQKMTLPNGLTVAYLECMVSIWGDISSQLIRALKTYSKLKCLVYLGKAGSLGPDDRPNERVVTGGRSHIGEDITTWANILGPELEHFEKVMTGDIVTVPSPLCESFDWLKQWQPKCRWVDCEVGHMAQASRKDGIKFGYLHTISDNVAGGHGENLSNESSEIIQRKRGVLFHEVEAILEAFFNRSGTVISP